jgi:hypothetical protein
MAQPMCHDLVVHPIDEWKALPLRSKVAFEVRSQLFYMPAVCKLRGHPLEFRFATAQFYRCDEPSTLGTSPGPTGSVCRCGAVRVTDDEGS